MPSLTRLSPSIIVTTRRGTPSRRAIDVAASGSVGETTAPSTNAAATSSPSTSACATTATPTVVAATSPIASSEIGAEVRAQVAQRREERRRVEQRRQEGDSTSSGGSVDVREARDEAEREPAEHEQDRVRDPQDGASDEQRRHATSSPRSCHSSWEWSSHARDDTSA